MSFKNDFKKGLVWTFIENIFLRGFTFIVMLGLARLLSPKDFGLISVITIFILIGSSIIEAGMGNSIIRDNKATILDYTSVFYGNIILSLIIYPTLFFTAPIIAQYFNNNLLVNLIRVYSLSFIISAFFNIQESVLIKEMKFKKIATYNLPSLIIGSLIGLVMAYFGYGVWSLVWMHLSTLILKACLFWINSDWIPQPKISFKKLKDHFLFGYKLMISNLIDSLINEIYSFIIGKSFSISKLGYFTQAKTFRNYPVQLTSSVVVKVTYPLLSKIQDNKEEVSNVYRKIQNSVFFLICPIMFLLIVIAKPLFLLLLTEKWLPSVPYFQILAISGMLIPIHSFNLNIFKVFNRTDLFLKLEVVKAIMVIVSIIIGLNFGIYGLLISIVATSYLGFFINTFYSGKLINYTTKDQLKDMSPVFFIGVTACVLSYFISLVFKDLHNLLIVVFVTLSFISLYLTLSCFFNRKLFIESKTFLLKLVNKKVD